MPRKLLKFLILFDKPSCLYFPGEFLSGRVLLELQDETPALGLQFHVVGEGMVRVMDRSEDKEKYIDFKMRLLGNDGSSEVSVLSPGIHSFPFKLGLPFGLPSTFLGRCGHIQYFCKAALREPSGLTHKNHQVFIVMNPIDLNLEYPTLSKPFTAEISHTVGSKLLNCLSPASGSAGNQNKVHCKVMLDRGGYVPGENILLSAKVVNQSQLKIKGTRVTLTETIEYYMAKKRVRMERRDLVVIRRGKIRPFTMDELNEKIYVPPLPPTNLQGCNLINISYDVYFIIEPKSSMDKEIKLQIPIHLGTYPYRENGEANDDIENLWPDQILKPETHYPATLPIFRPWLNEPLNGSAK